MPENSSCSMVLVRFFPKKKLICVLNDLHGKINIRASDKILDYCWPGTIFDSVVVEKSHDQFFLERVDRSSQLRCPDVNSFAWLQAFIQFCHEIIPLNQPCLELFKTLEKIFKFCWIGLGKNAEILLRQACTIELLRVSGCISGVYAQKFQKLFDLLLHFKVDLDGILGVEFSNNDFELFDEKHASLIEQVQNNLPSNLVEKFFCLLKPSEFNYDLKNETI